MKDSTSALRFAGDIQLEKVVLSSLNGQTANVAAQVISIEVYEDIFSPFMSVSMVLRESVDYINMFPFIGEEYLDLSVKTPSAKRGIEGKFYIYKITDRSYTKDREVVYTIKAISEEWIVDANRKLSQTFKGNVGELVEPLLQKTGLNTAKAYYVEKTANKTAFTASYWTPVKCLTFLATNATSDSKSPTYLFFENRNGFNFRSIDELLKANSYQKFVKDNFSRDVDSPASASASKDPEQDYRRIISLEVPTLTDYMEDIQTGRLKSRIISHDIVTKQYIVKDYSVKKDENPPTLLNKSAAYTKYATSNSISTTIVMNKHYGNYSGFSDVTNFQTVQKRMSFFQNLQKYKVTIEVLGRTDYTVGQVVELSIPRATQIEKGNSNHIDMILSGKYLVSAIAHFITKESHICSMELIKNSIMLDTSKA